MPARRDIPPRPPLRSVDADEPPDEFTLPPNARRKFHRIVGAALLAGVVTGGFFGFVFGVLVGALL